MPENSLQKITIDSEWDLVDLYRFPHSYTQVYAFLYSLSQAGRINSEAVSRIYRAHPWRGGYSSLNFYMSLYSAMEDEHIPTVHSIRYASLGYIEITALTILVTQIRRIVTIVAQTIEIADRTYDRIYKRAQKRKLLAMDVRRREREFEREEIKFMVESAEELARIMSFDDLEKLQVRTRDPLGTMKILLSFYRRVRELVGFQLDQKVRFDCEAPQLDKKDSST